MPVTESFEFMAVCIGNFFTSQGNLELQPETSIREVIEHLCYVIKKCMNNSQGILFEEDDLIKASINISYFGRRLESLLRNNPLAWSHIFLVMGMYAQVLEYLTNTSDEILPYATELNRLCREYEVNNWIQKQPSQWHSFMDFYKNPTV